MCCEFDKANDANATVTATTTHPSTNTTTTVTTTAEAVATADGRRCCCRVRAGNCLLLNSDFGLLTPSSACRECIYYYRFLFIILYGDGDDNDDDMDDYRVQLAFMKIEIV